MRSSIMRVLRRALPAAGALAATAVFVAAAAGAVAGGVGPVAQPAATITIPLAWQGVWHVTQHQVDCNTHAVIATTTRLDTLCAGQAYNVPSDAPCTGLLTDTNVSLTCTTTYDVIPGCTVTVTHTITGSRTGDTYSGSTVSTMAYSGALCPLPSSCTEYDWTATRGTENPQCVPAANADESWSVIKQQYH